MSDPADLYGLMCLAAPELAAAIAPKSLRMAKETCVDKELSRHLADIIYDALSRDGQRFKISTLIEHKSQWEHAMGLLLQLLRYNLNFFQEAHTLLLSQGEEMPVPINIVLYHGERPLGDLAFIRQFRHNLSESLQKRLLNFEPVLIDLGHLDTESLRAMGYHFLASGMTALEHARDTQFLERNFVALLLFEGSDNPDNLYKLNGFVRYMACLVKWSKTKFQDMVASLPPAQANAFKSTYDMILEKGIEISRREMLVSQVRNMLKRQPDWSDEAIAELLGIDAPFVAALRTEG